MPDKLKNFEVIISNHYESLRIQLDAYVDGLLQRVSHHHSSIVSLGANNNLSSSSSSSTHRRPPPPPLQATTTNKDDDSIQQVMMMMSKQKQRVTYGLDALADHFTDKYTYQQHGEMVVKSSRVDELIVLETNLKLEEFFMGVDRKKREIGNELSRAEKENLIYYESYSHGFTIEPSDNNLETLRSQVFANKFCFFLNLHTHMSVVKKETSKMNFNLSLVITDFYLNAKQISYLQNLIRGKDLECCLDERILDEKLVIVEQLFKYIWGKTMNSMTMTYNEIIVIDMRTLNSINKIKLVSRPNIDMVKLAKQPMETSAVAFDLSQLKSLELYLHGMVKEFDITGLVNLEHLCLEKVKLGSSPFISNPNLRTLNLITCILPPCISWLTSTPTALANLKCLEITHCWWVKKLKFKGLEQLNYLFLTQNRLEHISSTYFFNLGELVVLDLSYNKIRGFGDTPFVNLTNLKSLNLDWNAIPYLKESWFEGLNNLEELSLRNNCIEEFPVGIFSSLKTLKHLRLNSNPAQQFTDSFIGLENLETLSLSQMGKGKFNRVEVATLNGLRKLNELLLCDNNIEFIESGSFRVMSNLTILNLNGNKLVIEECGRILSKDLSSLKTLSLGSNRFGEMSDSLFVNLGKLEHLSLISNDLDHLGADCFDGLSNLRELNLAGNDFVEFDIKCLENLSKLRVVNLEENPITDYEQLEENLSALGIRVYHGI